MTLQFILYLYLKYIISLGLFATVLAKKDYSVCQTKPCTELAKQLKKELNDSFAPCDDLYKFTCNNWIKNHPIPHDEMEVSKFHIGHGSILNKIEELLGNANSPDDTKAFQMAKDIYKKCINIESLDKAGITPILRILDEYDDWPILKPTSEQINKTWQEYDNQMYKKYLIDSFYNLQTSEYKDENNVKKYTAELSPPKFFFNTILAELGTNLEPMRAYKDYMKKIITRIARAKNSRVSEKEIKSDVNEIVKLEKKLAKILRNVVTVASDTTMGEFQSMFDKTNGGDQYTSINWFSIFKEMFAQVNVSVTDTTSIIVYDRNTYFLNLPKILRATDSRTIKNYIIWRFLEENIKETDSIMRNYILELNNKAFGVNEAKTREKACIESHGEVLYNSHHENLYYAIGYGYAKKYFPKDAKVKAEKYVRNIIDAAKSHIKKSNWLSENSKKNQIEKIDTMKIYIGYPNWFTDEAIDEYYADYRPESGYFESILSLKKFLALKNLKKIGQHRDEPTFNPLTVNAAYNGETNEIVFTMALMELLFNAELPPVFNYATLGISFAHIIFTAFNTEEDFSHKINSNELPVPETDLQKFRQNQNCFIDLFDKQIIEEAEPLNKNMHVNGNLTVMVNLAEAVGLSVSFIAYKQHIERNEGKETRLPDLETYDGDRLFFIIYGNQFCENLRPSMIETIVVHDVHVNLHLRIQVTAANSKEFGDTFQCPIGSPMNPKHKCSLYNTID
ncbi:neprilysin-1-like [Prorops nasuta]|uniref:neprilysin-1-like n=1 Tax=Prorops nasuta TaxID=863751 RepID=UPI0034CDB59A